MPPTPLGENKINCNKVFQNLLQSVKTLQKVIGKSSNTVTLSVFDFLFIFEQSSKLRLFIFEQNTLKNPKTCNKMFQSDLSI